MRATMKKGLVLEGGAHRAIYTAGILDVFMENGISFDGVIGVSAGAIHGGSFVAGQKGRNIKYTLKYANDRRYMSFYSLITTGDIVGKKFCYEELPNKLVPFDYKAFAKAKTEFYVTCSNVETGKPEYIKCSDMHKQMDCLRASASLPYVSRIVEIGKKKLLDGGITDSIPVRAFQKMGYSKCVVVQTRPEGYIKEPDKLLWLGKFLYRKYPNFIKALCLRHVAYNANLADIGEQQKQGKIFVIRPSENIKISRMEKNSDIIKAVYELGRKDALSSLPQMKKFLDN